MPVEVGVDISTRVQQEASAIVAADRSDLDIDILTKVQREVGDIVIAADRSDFGNMVSLLVDSARQSITAAGSFQAERSTVISNFLQRQEARVRPETQPLFGQRMARLIAAIGESPFTPAQPQYTRPLVEMLGISR